MSDKIKSDIQKASVGTLVNLYSIDLSPITTTSGDVYYFTDGVTSSGTAPVWNGETYTPIPMELAGTEFDGKQLPRPILRVGDANSSASAAFISWIVTYEDMVGATITRTRTFEKYLDGQPEADNTACFLPDLYTISQKTSHTRSNIEWELTGYMDMVGISLPRRQVLKNTCTHTYRVWNATAGAFNYDNCTCPYRDTFIFKATGEYSTDNSQDSCGKKLSDCKLRYIDFTYGERYVGNDEPDTYNTYDNWLDTSSIPAVWKMWSGTEWDTSPRYAPLPTRAFPGVARRGR